MKSIALVAPGVHPPLTEGRKLFVMDLAATLRARGVEVEVISGAPDAGGVRAIQQSLKRLHVRCESGDGVDGVAVFPYGRFEGLRSLANEWLLVRSLASARRRGIPVLPVFYSCAGLRIEDVDRKFGPALAIGRSAGKTRALCLGVSRNMEGWQPASTAMRRILFLCGYQQATKVALEGVLNERGLLDLLHAGNGLADAGIRLCIAIPFLRESSMRDRLLELASKICPGLEIDLQDSIDPSHVFSSHDAFVFPYRAEHAVFVPTSLLEAMLAGIPVVAASHEMYRLLTEAGGMPRCGLHRAGDPNDLLMRVLEMRDNYDLAVQRAREGASAIARDWTLEKSADEFMAAFKESAFVRH